MKGNGQPRSARAQASKAEAKAREAGGEALEAGDEAPEAGGERKRELAQEESSAKERGPVGERLDRLCSLTSRKRDPEARRRAILNAAIDVIVEKGAAALTHRAVAVRAGVSLGSTTKYFSSIEDLRESAMDALVREMDAGVDAFESELEACDDVESYCIELACEYLQDVRQVRADVALLNAGARDDGLREIALRNPDRLIAVLAPHFGAERAMALELCLEGALVHSALRSTPIDKEVIERIFRAILSAPWPGQEEARRAKGGRSDGGGSDDGSRRADRNKGHENESYEGETNNGKKS